MVFRGTSECSDFLGDLTALPVSVYRQDNQNLTLHCGFRDQYVAVSTALAKKVEVRAIAGVKAASFEQKPFNPLPIRLHGTFRRNNRQYPELKGQNLRLQDGYTRDYFSRSNILDQHRSPPCSKVDLKWSTERNCNQTLRLFHHLPFLRLRI